MADAPTETVKLTDGRLVDFVGKRKMVKESFVKDDGAIVVRIDFRNGETRSLPLNQDLVPKFAAHGAEQKYGDECAGLDDIDDMVIAVDDLHARLSKGEWNQKREASGIAGTSVLVRALVEMYAGAKTVEQVKTFLAGKSQAEKMALRLNARVKPFVEKIEAERASRTAKIDTDSALASLDALA